MVEKSLFSEMSQNIDQMLSMWLGIAPQLGLININQMKSSDHRMEQQIVREVAGYGKQLGRVIEAMEVLCKVAVGDGPPTEEDREVFAEFSEMATEIAAAKAGYIAMTSTEMTRLKESIRYLRKHNRTSYEDLRQELMEVLEVPETSSYSDAEKDLT